MCLEGELAISKNLFDFVFMMACANTVFPVEETEGDITFESQSPDELALVEGARNIGLRLHSRGPTMCQYAISKSNSHNNEATASSSPSKQGGVATVTIAGIHEFNSTRKRMSIVARDGPSGPWRVFVKGADNVMLERAEEKFAAHQSMLHNQLVEYVTSPASDDSWTTLLIDCASNGIGWSFLYACLFSGYRYGKVGLRTLVYGVRDLTDDEFQTWRAK